MQAYNEGVALVELLRDLVDRHPVHEMTAEGWYDIADKLLQIAYAIRHDAWKALPAEARQRALTESPELRHLTVAE